MQKKKINKGTYNWLMAGAENNYTEQKNIKDLENIKIEPKILNKTDKINLKCKFFKHFFTKSTCSFSYGASDSI